MSKATNGLFWAAGSGTPSLSPVTYSHPAKGSGVPTSPPPQEKHHLNANPAAVQNPQLNSNKGPLNVNTTSIRKATTFCVPSQPRVPKSEVHFSAPRESSYFSAEFGHIQATSSVGDLSQYRQHAGGQKLGQLENSNRSEDTCYLFRHPTGTGTTCLLIGSADPGLERYT